MPGLDAEKKKKDLALSSNKSIWGRSTHIRQENSNIPNEAGG